MSFINQATGTTYVELPLVAKYNYIGPRTTLGCKIYLYRS